MKGLVGSQIQLSVYSANQQPQHFSRQFILLPVLKEIKVMLVILLSPNLHPCFSFPSFIPSPPLHLPMTHRLPLPPCAIRFLPFSSHLYFPFAHFLHQAPYNLQDVHTEYCCQGDPGLQGKPHCGSRSAYRQRLKR